MRLECGSVFLGSFVLPGTSHRIRPERLAQPRRRSRRRTLVTVFGLALSLFAANGTAYAADAASDTRVTPSAAAVPLEPPAPPPAGAQHSGQSATTQQAADTTAVATDPQPMNILISVRINSPGNNGPVAQTSTAAIAGAAGNTGTTTQADWQDWAPARGSASQGSASQGSAQDAGTGQKAAATSAATQPRPVNAAVSVRLNSPGDDGPVTQTSAVLVGAASTNSASTTQAAVQKESGAAGGTSAASPSSPSATAPAPARLPAATPQPSSAAPAKPESTAAQSACVGIERDPGSAGEPRMRIVITIDPSCRTTARPRPAASHPARPAKVLARSARPQVEPARAAASAPSATKSAGYTTPQPSSLAKAHPATPATRARLAPPRRQARVAKGTRRVPQPLSIGRRDALGASVGPAMAFSSSGVDGRRDLVILVLLVATIASAAFGSWLPAELCRLRRPPRRGMR
jgi:hypothetical protein